ncbi:unnamed protein product [Sphagnum compactum]
MASGNNVKFALNDPEFNCFKYNLGYLNSRGYSCFFYRIPVKQYRQGLRSDQVSYRFTKRSHGIEFKRSKYMAEMLENRYPSFEQCCKLLKEDEAEVIAFDRNFALGIDKIHEDYILEYKGEENGDTRIGNNFCLRTRDAEGQITELVSSIKSSGHIVFLNNSNRYSATNFASLIKFGTIEFRSLECTTDIDRVVHWIKTVQALKMAAREYDNPREIIAQFSRMGIHKFIRHNLQDCAYKYLNLPGYSQMMRDAETHLIMMNSPNCVANASDKLEAFKYFTMAGVSVPDWTDDCLEAFDWLEKHTVICRTKLTGHSGDGIIVCDKGSKELPDAPLYTKYIYKTKEYRVHVCNGQVIDTQKKIRDPDWFVTDWKVRSHQNGFIYARNNVFPEILRDEMAIAATTALGLNFGAVDIIEDKNEKLYVLEVNTAPGLEGKTVELYAEAFRSACQG